MVEVTVKFGKTEIKTKASEKDIKNNFAQDLLSVIKSLEEYLGRQQPETVEGKITLDELEDIFRKSVKANKSKVKEYVEAIGAGGLQGLKEMISKGEVSMESVVEKLKEII